MGPDLFVGATVYLVILSLTFMPTGRSDLAYDNERASLLLLRSSVGGRSLLWNLSSSPCSWVGVTCRSGRVTDLHLPGMGLSGKLPVGAFGNLTKLNTLSLRFNALRGEIPSDLAFVTGLRSLYLQGNFFSGEVPAFLYFNLTSLVRLNLANNNFSGEISPGFNNLTRLGTLYLENNSLTGSIPELKLPSLVQFNVSNNQLNGSVPSTLSDKPTSSFSGNSLCGKPLNSCSESGNESKNKLSGGAIAGIAIACAVGLILVLAVLIFLCSKKNKSKTDRRDVEVAGVKSDGSDNLASGSGAVAPVTASRAEGKANGGKNLVFFGKYQRSFDLDGLLRASAEVLGKGSFGTTYKAILDAGSVVAVKRLKDVTVPEKEFREKIEAVGAMDNENLVPLIAYYYSPDEKLLVYEFIPLGSLSALLHGNKGASRTPLNWETRSLIALGAAHGIAYIHSRAPNSSHGNIKSSNVLLTESYGPRVSDSGLSQIVGATTPHRADGYRAPEVTDACKISQKADVYSFGVLLLELLTGKAPTHALLNEEGVDLPRWVQSFVRDEWTSEVFDIELLRDQNVEEEMVRLLQLAIDCTAQYPDSRPSMAEVSSKIEEICRPSLREERNVESSIDGGSS